MLCYCGHNKFYHNGAFFRCTHLGCTCHHYREDIRWLGPPPR